MGNLLDEMMYVWRNPSCPLIAGFIDTVEIAYIVTSRGWKECVNTENGRIL